LSSVAELLEKDFAKYYDYFMPGLKNLLANLPATN